MLMPVTALTSDLVHPPNYCPGAGRVCIQHYEEAGLRVRVCGWSAGAGLT